MVLNINALPTHLKQIYRSHKSFLPYFAAAYENFKKF